MASVLPSSDGHSTSGLHRQDADYGPTTRSFDATTSTHSVLAGRMVEQIVEESPVIDQCPALRSALDSLKHVLDRMHENPDMADPSIGLWNKPMDGTTGPSRAELHRILEKADTSLFFTFFPVLTVQYLKLKVERIFNYPMDDISVRGMLVFGVLFHLCLEYSEGTTDPLMGRRYSALAKVFSLSLQAAIASLPLVLAPSAEAIPALVVGAISAIELCRPHLALALASTAARMVVFLGYNRLSSMQNDTEQERQHKIYLFWMVYILDTSFPILLGRSPVMRDHDIAVPMIADDSVIPTAFVRVLHYWVEIGRVQCQAVEYLYSPSALLQSLDERSKRATKLVERLQQAWAAREEVSTAHCFTGRPASYLILLQNSDAIMHHSTISLIQHAARSIDDSDSPALETARHALRLTIAMGDIQTRLTDSMWAAHCHWTLIYAPFTPFTVTFCHIIANTTNAANDLRLLQDFVRTLETLSHYSKGVAKLHRLCHVFEKVATLYVQAKAVEAANATVPNNSVVLLGSLFVQPEISEVNAYLSTIGFAPPAANSIQADSIDGAPTYLNDWFYGNSSLMSLLG